MHSGQRQLGGDDLGSKRVWIMGIVLFRVSAGQNGGGDGTAAAVGFNCSFGSFFFHFFPSFFFFFSQLLRNSCVAHVAVKFHGT